ncbi:glycosyltransferase family 4 protein [Rhizobium oryzicola]|uniref:Glycosyltransferase family 4 protein n=1 Tax=Rhizobium oryzicola TaxID=1232668 RepID=A0ABT8SSH1_9HYPH|nr:glycosyltransferase family 4 protein [Rhizobium oryzicola]MDO1581352.1 glycosyltransferase family 4 protein [Rhizobium oryzicola]
MPPILYLTTRDYARRTGGYVYNTELVAALSAQSVPVEPVELETGFPTVPESERAALLQHLGKAEPRTIILTDHIYTHDLLPVLEKAGVPVVSIFHHSLVIEQGDRTDEASTKTRQREGDALRFSHRIITTSHESRAYLQAHYGIAPDRIHVAVPGNAPVNRSAASAGDFQILSVGAVIARKRYDYVLDVAVHLPARGWRWAIVGDPARDPSLVAALKARAEALGLTDRVTFAGDVADAALEDLWQQTSLYVAASYYEGYGMAVAEALRHGVPVVSTASGAVSTWTSAGVTEAPADDAGQMAALVRRFMDEPGYRAAEAENAWQFGQTLLTWEETFAGMAEWLAER